MTLSTSAVAVWYSSGFLQLLRSGLDLLELPTLLIGDDGLVGEGFDQRDLPSRKGRRGTPNEGDRADRCLPVPGRRVRIAVEHLRLATSDGGELQLWSAGAGRPVILMHGVTLQWWVWSAVIRLLRSRYQVIAWDMRGHGESRAGHRGVSLERARRSGAAAGVARPARRDRRRPLDGRHVPRSVRAVATTSCSTNAWPAWSSSPRAPPPRRSPGVRGGLCRRLRAGSRCWPIAAPGGTGGLPLAGSNLSAVMVRGAFGPRATARMLDDVRRMLAEVPDPDPGRGGASIAAHDVRAGSTAVDVADRRGRR